MVTDKSDLAAPGTNDPTATEPTPSRGGVYGFIALLLVGAVIVWAAYVFITGTDGFNWKRFTFRDRSTPLVTATGELYFNDEPLNEGVVEAYLIEPTERRLTMGSIKDGKFKLTTDVNGLFVEGAVVGTYKIVVNVNHPFRAGQQAPDRMLPEEYYNQETTPVTIEVTSDPETNHFVLKLKGQLRPRPSGRGARKKRPSSDAIVNRVFENDKNSDGKLSRDEAPDRLKANFDRIDSDKDGHISKEEMRSSLQRRNRRKTTPAKSKAKA